MRSFRVKEASNFPWFFLHYFGLSSKTKIFDFFPGSYSISCRYNDEINSVCIVFSLQNGRAIVIERWREEKENIIFRHSEQIWGWRFLLISEYLSIPSIFLPLSLDIMPTGKHPIAWITVLRKTSKTSHLSSLKCRWNKFNKNSHSCSIPEHQYNS